MRVVVCGGRDFTDQQAVYLRLAELPRGTVVIHGGARGADRMAAIAARALELPVQEIRADWGTHGRAAGHIRNGQILKLDPDLVIAFPGGLGTASCIAQAQAKGIPVEQAVASGTLPEGQPNP